MTSVKCLHCDSEQDFEETVGYCEKCGHKLPVPHQRGKHSAREKFMAEQRSTGLGPGGIWMTIGFLAVLILGIVGLVVL